MRSNRLQGWLTIGAMLALPVMAHAQEATLSGTVSDTTGGALPGVTVRAVHEASGNSFETVTDTRGGYRLPLRIGTFQITGELAGFAPVTRALSLLVGQQAVLNLQMSVSGVQESVTVTGEAPLLDVSTSTLGGNIDPRQMQEIPVQGRNWVDLTLLTPGARVNAVTAGAPSDAGAAGPAGSRRGGDFQLNVDGQQVTQLIVGSAEGQPGFSRDAIAEFEFSSSRFDATQGRSSGMQVNAVTKSGTNTPSGSFAGYFRDDRFNAADHVAKRVLPYKNQQLSGTFGGPIRKDKVHAFVHYEYEREPQTAVFTTPYAHFNRDLTGVLTQKKGGVRVDAQFSPRTRVAIRGTLSRFLQPEGARGGSATSTPSAITDQVRRTNQLLATLTQVLGNRVVNEVKVGHINYATDNPHMLLKDPGGRFGFNGPPIALRGLTLGGTRFFPQRSGQDGYTVRDDFTYSFEKGGRHTMKLGAEYLFQEMTDLRCVNCLGSLDATGGAIPSNIESLFPDIFDVSTWNLAPLSPISVRWQQAFAASLSSSIPRYTSAAWVQDDWSVSPRLTLNLGLRYDLERNAFANDVALGPFLPGGRPDDTNNVGPRLGFSFSQNERTVMRGGFGVYFGTVTNAHYTKYYSQIINIAVENDGRPDFASNPWNGPAPTYESLKPRLCTPALAPGCIRAEAPTGNPVYGPNFTMPYSYQSSIGLQQQLGGTMAIEADYVYIGDRDRQNDPPINLSFDPATGANYTFTDISRRPYPEWGFVSLTVNGARSNSHSLQTALTKRFSGGWQASGTYTLSTLRDAYPPPLSGLSPVPFPTAPDLGGEYSLAVGDQRHRAVFNGIWQLRYGFQLSGLYFFGSGERYSSSYGTDVRRIGATRPTENRLRPDGTIVPRNNFVGKAIHRVDLRVKRRFPLGGRAGIDGFVEVFNAFNHANFGAYVTQEVARNYGQPSQNTNVAYTPRALQLGFRFAF